MDALIAAVAGILGTLFSGRFVLDRPSRQRRELTELSELINTSPAAARPALEKLVATRWVRLLVPRPASRALANAAAIVSLLVIATSVASAVLDYAARSHFNSARSLLDESDNEQAASLRDGDLEVSQFVKVAPVLSTGKALTSAERAQLSSIASVADRARSEEATGDRLYRAGRRESEMASARNAIGTDFAVGSFLLAIVALALMIAVLAVRRREDRDQQSAVTALTDAFRQV